MKTKDYWKLDYAKRKQKIIDLLGGKCAVCGSTEKLQFDHIDSQTKSFALTTKIKSPNLIKEEILKCQLFVSLMPLK